MIAASRRVSARTTRPRRLCGRAVERVSDMSSAARPAAKPRSPQPLEQRILVTATLCLLAAGAVMVYSASSARTLLQGQGDGTGSLIKSLIYGAIGLVVMRVLSR